MEKDYSYLDDLAGETYGFIYNRLIHKLKQEKREAYLKSEISKLSEEEKAYLRKWVTEAFEQLGFKNKKTEM